MSNKKFNKLVAAVETAIKDLEAREWDALYASVRDESHENMVELRFATKAKQRELRRLKEMGRIERLLYK